MKKIVILLIAFMLISVGFLSGCNETKETSRTEDTPESEIEQGIVIFDTSEEYETTEPFKVEGLENLQVGRCCYITGKVKNNYNRTLNYIEIEIKTFDSNNQYLESHTITNQYLGSGQTWPFSRTLYGTTHGEGDKVIDLDHVEYVVAYYELEDI